MTNQLSNHPLTHQPPPPRCLPRLPQWAVSTYARWASWRDFLHSGAQPVIGWLYQTGDPQLVLRTSLDDLASRELRFCGWVFLGCLIYHKWVCLCCHFCVLRDPLERHQAGTRSKLSHSQPLVNQLVKLSLWSRPRLVRRSLWWLEVPWFDLISSSFIGRTDCMG